MVSQSIINDYSPSVGAVICWHLWWLNSPRTKLVHWRSPTNSSHATERGTWKTQYVVNTIVTFLSTFLAHQTYRCHKRKRTGHVLAAMVVVVSEDSP